MRIIHAALAVSAVVAVAGCGRHDAADWHMQAQDQKPPPAAEGYVPPPQVVSVLRLPSGGLGLTGAAAPDASVRLRSPDGTILQSKANGDGVWTVDVPSVASVRLFGLSQAVGDSVTQGEGYLAVLPPSAAGTGAALLLRSGAGAQAFGEPEVTPRIAAVDIDAGGGGVVSGLGSANVALRVALDGQKAGEGSADGKGRFSIALTIPVTPGSHVITVQSAQDSAQMEFSVTPPPSFTQGPYVSQARPEGWRIDWMTPGGGAQTTFALDAAVARGRGE